MIRCNVVLTPYRNRKSLVHDSKGKLRSNGLLLCYKRQNQTKQSHNKIQRIIQGGTGYSATIYNVKQ